MGRGGGGGRTARNFENDALFLEGTEKWQKNMNIAVLSQGLLSRVVETNLGSGQSRN